MHCDATAHMSLDVMVDLSKLIGPSAHGPEHVALFFLSHVLAALKCLKGDLASCNLLAQAAQLSCSGRHELLLLIHCLCGFRRQLQLCAQRIVPVCSSCCLKSLSQGGSCKVRMSCDPRKRLRMARETCHIDKGSDNQR